MGLFLDLAILPGCTKEQAIKAVKEAADANDKFYIEPAKCQYIEQSNGSVILFNEGIVGYNSLAACLSIAINGKVLYPYIYDDDFWGYYFYDKGQELDSFMAEPDYFGEEQMGGTGNAELIAKSFGVPRESIEKYLMPWSEEMYEEEAFAYEEDESGYCDCWQMADFMGKLGYPYNFPEE
ncbi:MAG: hypothetical protein J6D02_08660 [Lachnospira sp.]|nr:hypothetical protein [Lachnospira sp.]